MALELLFKNLDTNDLASLQPGSFAAKPKAPQPVDEGDATTAKSASAGAAAFPTYRTHVKIFQFSTGDDIGDSSELEGFIQFPNFKRNFASNLPNETSFRSENGGFGRLVADTAIDTAFTPANFRVYWYEQDDSSANDIIIDKSMDWSVPANLKFADGRAWSQEWWNRDDIAYKAYVWWQVTPLM
ncbi:hypothetical protein FBEOM_14497 [Fusarium beomiforme]|uniref:Uncharacterized protein n=1 Tax=Fusarium beomiforme TaxID=44412 RepID=A0A9P5DQ46_9HYPO|nr:hypothetical protein FBEOM_14497 [Fusarium beomiforme]